MNAKELLEQVKKDSVQFISLQFSDLMGAVKSVDIPVDRLPSALEDGVWFDGSSVEGFARIQESDMRLIVDPDTYAVLTWTWPELRRARVFCDIYTPSGQPFDGDPRGLLKRTLSGLEKRGWSYNIGAEPEFFLFKKREDQVLRPVTHDNGGYFDLSADDEAAHVRSALMEALSQMGLSVEMGHHETARGQHEIDFRFSDALRSADNILTLKYVVKSIAHKHGLTASFMPKPVVGINGSGMHCHQSLFDAKGTNLFFDAKGQMSLSPLAHSFIAGQLNHARALAAVVSPTVNSYKRLVPGYEAPVYVTWAQANRSALIRVPAYMPGRDKAVRTELRFPDPSANPYLAFTVMLAAALDGIDSKLQPPAPMNNVNLYEMGRAERTKMGVGELPGSLAEALESLSEDEVLKAALGNFMYESYSRVKWEEWDDYRIHVTDYEIERYLETA